MATVRQRELARRALDQRLDGVRASTASLAVPQGGWLRAIRDALGLSSAVVGNRLGLDDSTVRRIERNEREGVIQLDTLVRTAAALGCDVVYALVPRRPLNDTVVERATLLAQREIADVDHTMALEDQRTPVDSHRIHELANELIRTGNVTWDE
jgi:predicted DNA-binding mobile mystery protein A